MAAHRRSFFRDLSNIQRWRFVIYSRTAVSFRKVSTCAWGSSTKPVTAVSGSIGTARFVTQSLFQLWGGGMAGRISTPRMITSSATWNSSKRRDNKVTSDKKSDHEHGSVLMQVFDQKKEPKQLTLAGKAVQAGKDITYLFIIAGGFVILAFLLYSVGSEFFASDSPSSIFSKTLKRVKTDEKVKAVLGEPIVGHGEETGRGRRRHINHLEYIKEGRECMVMKFYVSGKKRKGEVRLDLMKNDKGKYECKYLDVELVGYPPGRIVLENNYSLPLQQ